MENLNRILTGGKRLANLLNDILDLSKLESGAGVYDMKPCDIYTLVRRVMDEVGSLAQKKSIHIELQENDTEPKIECDCDKIHQVVLNVLSNAIKFTPECKQIRIEQFFNDGFLNLQ